jgi:hypothetical protein
MTSVARASVCLTAAWMRQLETLSYAGSTGAQDGAQELGPARGCFTRPASATAACCWPVRAVRGDGRAVRLEPQSTSRP